MLVPQRAIIDIQGQFQVAVVEAGNKVNIRTVKLGPQSDSFRIIDAEVRPGEGVVIEGQQKVVEGMQVKPLLEPAERIPSTIARAVESRPRTSIGAPSPPRLVRCRSSLSTGPSSRWSSRSSSLSPAE